MAWPGSHASEKKFVLLSLHRHLSDYTLLWQDEMTQPKFHTLTGYTCSFVGKYRQKRADCIKMAEMCYKKSWV